MSCSFSGVKRLRNATKVAGAVVPPAATVLNLSGLTLTAPSHVVTNLELSDTWGEQHVDPSQISTLVDFLVNLNGAVHLRAVCHAGRNRSRFAASLYAIMFSLLPPLNGEPERNLEFRALLEAARVRAQEPGASAVAIGEAVVLRAQAIAAPPPVVAPPIVLPAVLHNEEVAAPPPVVAPPIHIVLPAVLNDEEVQHMAEEHNVPPYAVRDEEERRRAHPNLRPHHPDLNMPHLCLPCNDLRCCGIDYTHTEEELQAFLN